MSEYYYTNTADIRCLKDYIIKGRIGKGAFGVVKGLCKKKNCKYIVKISSNNTTRQKNLNLNEIAIYRRLKNKGITPKYHGSWECDNKFYLILEKWDNTVNYLLSKKTKINKNKEIQDQIYRLLNKLHKNKILHGDLHFGNFLYKKTKNKLKLALIDFGLSNNFNTKKELALSIVKPPKFNPIYDFAQIENKLREHNLLKYEIDKPNYKKAEKYLVNKFKKLHEYKLL